MTASQWERRAARQIALYRALDSRLEADSLAWDEAMQRAFDATFTGDSDRYVEARWLTSRMKRTQLRIERLQSRMKAHQARMLSVWDAEGKPS